MAVLLVRHAEDSAAAEHRFGDEGLSERGVEQACALARSLHGRKTLFSFLDDIGDEHHAVEYRDAEQRNEPDAGRDGEGIPAQEEREDAAGNGQRHIQVDQGSELAGGECAVEEHKNEQQRQRHQHGQTFRRGLEILELSAPFHVPAGRQFEFVIEKILRFSHE